MCGQGANDTDRKDKMSALQELIVSMRKAGKLTSHQEDHSVEESSSSTGL